MAYKEHHRVHRSGWLRAAVMGANDGIVSTASLIIGIAAANTAQTDIILAGVAGLVAGAMSMAAGEYVSVSSQADTEKADLALERDALENNTEYEAKELAEIYVERGLDEKLATEVAAQLMEHDALGAHARDELGINEIQKPRPVQAAATSAFMFTLGSSLPLLAAALSPRSHLITYVAFLSLIFLATLGVISARAGGASMLKGASRVTFWGAAAMSLTAVVGHIFGIVV